MRKSASMCFCLLLSGVLMFSCKPKDQDLQKTIETVLSTTNTGVQTTVKDGVATLTGVVDSQEAKNVIETTVKGIKDIKSVVNNIEVKAPDAPAPITPEITLNADDALKTIINTALTAGNFKDVVIDVKEGIVTLTGSAKKADLATIMQIANEAKPKKVVNELKLN